MCLWVKVYIWLLNCFWSNDVTGHKCSATCLPHFANQITDTIYRQMSWITPENWSSGILTHLHSKAEIVCTSTVFHWDSLIVAYTKSPRARDLCGFHVTPSENPPPPPQHTSSLHPSPPRSSHVHLQQVNKNCTRDTIGGSAQKLPRIHTSKPLCSADNRPPPSLHRLTEAGRYAPDSHRSAQQSLHCEAWWTLL